MPVAALIDEKILCMHGGISPDLKSLEEILYIPRPMEIPDKGFVLFVCNNKNNLK